MMMRSLFLLSWLSVALAGHEGARSSNLRRTQAQPSNSSLPNGPGLLASATFLGFNVTVPLDTVLNLSFVATFGPSYLETPRRLDGLMVPAVFNSAGRDHFLLSDCGKYDAATNVFRGRTVCVRSLVVNDIQRTPHKFVAVPNVTSHFPLITANQSGMHLDFGGMTIFPDVQGFYFSIVSAASSPITLSKIKVTGADLKSIVDVPDISLPAAVPATTPQPQH